MKRFLGCLFGVALINAGCSSAAEPTAGSGVATTSSPAASPAPEAPARERLTRPIPRTDPTSITVHTLPLAECALEAIDTSAATEAAGPLTLYSDSEGTVHFQSRVTDPRASSVAMHLDCTDAAGKTSSQEVDLVIDDAAVPALPPAARVSRVRPALTGDPTTYSREELVARDMPPRPDPVASPASYAHWLELATRPVNIIEPETVTSSRVKHGSGTSPSWCGNFVTDPSRDYFYVYGTWTLPKLTNQGGFWSTTYGSTWVGLGTSDIIQDGVEQDTSSRFYVESSSNYAWYEWWPAGTINFANFPVSPGDEVTAWTWIVDANNYFSDQGQYAHFMLYNATQGNLTSIGPYAKPFSQASTATRSADWIEEAPTGVPIQLTHFATYTMSDAFVEDFRTHQLLDFSESGSFNNATTMVDAKGNVMSTVTPDGVGAMTFTWRGYQ